MPTPTYDEVVDLIDGNLADLSDIKPAEHREVEKAILDYAKTFIEESNEVSSDQLQVLADVHVQLSDHYDPYPTGGGVNFSSCERLNETPPHDSRYKVSFNDNMDGRMFVVLSVESRGTASNSWNMDNDIVVSWKNLLSNSIEFMIREVAGEAQTIRVHITIVKY